MPGMAAEQAKKRTARPAAQGPSEQKQAQGGLRERLHRLPPAAGVALLIAMLALALPLGNMRALQRATPTPFLRQGDVASIVEDRIDAAENVLSVAGRAGLDEDEIRAAQTAIGDMEQATAARDISRADQALSASISRLTAAEGLGADETAMRRAADDFAEQGSFLRQEARAYNEQAKEAEALYEKLPTKALLREPDVYEGV